MFYRRINYDTHRQHELTCRPEHPESWAQVLTKAPKKLVLSLLLQLLLLHSSVCRSFVPYRGGSTFCSFAAGGSKAPHQHGHLCASAVSPPKTIQIPHGSVLPTHWLVHVHPWGFLFLFCFPLSLLFYFFNLNKECSRPHLRDFWAPFQKLLGLSSLTCN